MNWSILKGKWDQAESQMRMKWNKLTDDDIGMVRARNQDLIGRLRERYGWENDRAEREVNQFLDTLGGGGRNKPRPERSA